MADKSLFNPFVPQLPRRRGPRDCRPSASPALVDPIKRQRDLKAFEAMTNNKPLKPPAKSVR